MTYIIEIATGNYASTKAAISGGASRIELCNALSEGGITQSYGYLKKCREDFAIPLFPIIRPRGGDFLYTDEEFDLIRKDVLFCRDIKFDGIVTGFLNTDGSIDYKRTSMIVELAHPLPVTFHRAYDRCHEPFAALEAIIQAGCSKILTSGQQAAAVEGISLIKELVRTAANRITIMPGGGVRKENIAILARKTGATEFHSSLRSSSDSAMAFHHPNFKNDRDEISIETVTREDVQELVEALRQ